MPASGNRSFTNQRRCWLAGHTSAEKLNESGSIGGRERGRETFTSETRRPFAEELWKGLKNHGLKSTSDNQVIEKEEKHFPPRAESKRGEDKEALWDYQERVTIQTSEGKGSQVAGGHVWWHVQEEQGSSLRVREMPEDWKLKRVENQKQLPWGMQ